MPTVVAGDDHALGVDLAAVATLLDLPFEMPAALPAAELLDRLRHVLATAMRLAAQFPPAALATTIPNRDRTCLALANHIVEIAVRYVDVATGHAFDEDASVAIPKQELGLSDLALRAEAIDARLAARPVAAEQRVQAFFGVTTLHAVLERCTWHAAQHTRQLTALLERAGIEPEAPLTAEDLDGLPLPADVWD